MCVFVSVFLCVCEGVCVALRHESSFILFVLPTRISFNHGMETLMLQTIEIIIYLGIV